MNKWEVLKSWMIEQSKENRFNSAFDFAFLHVLEQMKKIENDEYCKDLVRHGY